MSFIHSSIRRAVATVMRGIVDTVYPKTCAGCRMRGMWLCDLCEEETLGLHVPGVCGRCGEPAFAGHCGCVELSPLIDRVRSVAVYDGWVGSAVRVLKYEGEPDRASHVASYMAPLVVSLGNVDALVPVPLHPRKERERGYNQSALLAYNVSKMTGLPVMNVLVRTRYTESQTRLSGQERWKNVSDVFDLDPTWRAWPGRSYALIDDVRTTGATLSACAVSLAEAAPSSIHALTFALDLQRDELTAYRDHVRRLRRAGMLSP